MTISRRDYIKAQAVAAAAAAAGMAVPSEAANLVTERDKTELTWSKAPCRFCGTGCSVMVATKDGQVVATHGDVKAEVNRGLNCVKGYFLSKIMYGEDRLTTPLLRMRDGEYTRTATSHPSPGTRPSTRWRLQSSSGLLQEKGRTAVGMFGSGQWTVWEGYAASKLMKAGFRTNNIEPNARHCMASAVAGFIRTFGIDEPMGCYDDFEARRRLRALGLQHGGDASDAMDPPDRPAPERAPRAKWPCSRPSSTAASTWPTFPWSSRRSPTWPSSTTSPRPSSRAAGSNEDFVAKHVNFVRGNADIGYGLRPEHPLQQKRRATPTRPAAASP